MPSLKLAKGRRGTRYSTTLLATAIFFGVSVFAYADSFNINEIDSGLDPYITYSSQYLGAGYVYDPQQDSPNQAGAGPAFVNDDDEQYFAFTIDTPTYVFMYTSGFMYGNFAPVLSLYQDVTTPPSGTPDPSNYLIMADNTGGPPCNLPTSTYPAATPGALNRGIDPTTGFCWDANVSQVLQPGSYLLVLTEYGNTAVGPTLANGFAEQGQGNFTGADGTGCGNGGSFQLYNYDCSARTGAGPTGLQSIYPNATPGGGNWIVTIDTTYTPEPEPGVLVLIGTLLIFGSRRVLNSVRNRQEK